MSGSRRKALGAALASLLVLSLGPLSSGAVAGPDDEGVTVCDDKGNCMTLLPLPSDEFCMETVEEVDVELQVCLAPGGEIRMGPLPGEVDDIDVPVTGGTAMFAILGAALTGSMPAACCTDPEPAECPTQCLLTGARVTEGAVAVGGGVVSVQRSQTTIKGDGEVRARASSVEAGGGDVSVSRFNATVQDDGGVRVGASAVDASDRGVSLRRASATIDPDGAARARSTAVDVGDDRVAMRSGSLVGQADGSSKVKGHSVVVDDGGGVSVRSASTAVTAGGATKSRSTAIDVSDGAVTIERSP